MKGFFINPGERRLRTGWRLLLFVVMFWLLASVVFLIKPLLGDITRREFLEGYSLLIVAVLAVAATVSVYLARRLLDKKRFRSLGLAWSRRALLDLAFGFFLSAAMAGTFLLAALALGVVEVTDIGITSTAKALEASTGFVQFMAIFSVGSMLVVLLEHVLVGYWEELVFRGYVFQNLREGIGVALAVVVTCGIFGLLHHANPNATWLSTAIIVLFGFLRVYGYLVTGMLWLSIGMHIGWNFFQGPIFGFAASGHEHATLLTLQKGEPAWLSGGAFGPEGSVLILPILLVTLAIMYRWGRKSARIHAGTVSG